MRKLGSVSHITKRGRIIVKAEIIPKLNSEVLDKNGKPIGKVIDLLGPVRSPFVAVKPYSKDSLKEIEGNELYVKR